VWSHLRRMGAPFSDAHFQPYIPGGCGLYIYHPVSACRDVKILCRRIGPRQFNGGIPEHDDAGPPVGYTDRIDDVNKRLNLLRWGFVSGALWEYDDICS